jgi:flagellar hook-associated protein 2
MAISVSGIGSGLDIDSLVERLMTFEARPLTQLQSKGKGFEAQLSAYGLLKSSLSLLQSSAASLRTAGTFEAVRATSSNTSVFTATATKAATRGSHSIEVLQIAQGQRLATNETSAPSVSPGSLTIDLGTYTYDGNGEATGFTSTSSVTIDLDEGDSLEDLRDAINASGAAVRASVINNGEARQLILSGTREGAASGFTLQGTGGLAGFSYDASDSAGSTLTSIEAAQNARIKIDGVTISRGSNTITDAIEGVTLNLLQAGEERMSLRIAGDTAAAKTAIEGFVKAYNDVQSTLRSLTNYNTENQQAAVLTGDATARGIQNQLRTALGSFIGEGEGVRTLSQLGISFTKAGTLELNGTVLERNLNDPDSKVAEFFTGADGKSGFANMLSDRLQQMLNSGGTLDSRQAGINASIKSLARQQETMLLRLESVETRYRNQFNALDSMIASMQQTSTYLQQQLAGLSSMMSNR